MTERTGRDALFEVLRTEGVRYIFGNPGSTELPLIDELADGDDISYALAMQEATAVGMADGYAQVTKRPAFLNLHTSAGLGNSIGNLTNARANRTPLVVTAGQQDYRHIVNEPLLSGDLEGIARGMVKTVTEVHTLAELGTKMRRAFYEAAGQPPGPVFVSLPMDILDELGHAPAPARSAIARDAVAGRIDEAADLLATTPVGKLGIVVGDEVAASGGQESIVALAEATAAGVHGSPAHSNTNFPSSHPLWAGPLPLAAAAISAALSKYERVLLVGGHQFLVYPFTPGPPMPPDVDLIQISPNDLDVGRTHPVRLGLVGDPGATVAALVPLIAARVDAGAVAVAIDEARRKREADIASRSAEAASRYDRSPMDPMAAMQATFAALPTDVAVVDEAITTGAYVRGFHRPERYDRYFFTRGGGLGWGMPAADGVCLANDREPTVCVVGDGSAMYSPQAIWTAAHMELPVVFIVVNNRQYLILKRNMAGMNGQSVKHDRWVAMHLDSPPVDFVGLARSMGVEGTLVEKAADVGEAVRSAYDTGRPHLLELPIAASI